VAAHEEQDERVVLLHHSLAVQCGHDPLVGWLLHDRDGFATPPGQLASQVIGHSPGGNLNQPATRIFRHALVGPLDGCRKQRLLDGIFRGVFELPVEALHEPDVSLEVLRSPIDSSGAQLITPQSPVPRDAFISSMNFMSLLLIFAPLSARSWASRSTRRVLDIPVAG
jgi:hypothetical protein